MKIRRTLLSALALLTLAGCGGSTEGDGNRSESGDATTQTEVTAEAGAPEADVEVVYDWREVDSVFYQTYFRVVKVNGQCLIEEYHYENGGTSIVLAPEACKR